MELGLRVRPDAWDTMLKWLSIVDEYTRERVALKVSRSVMSEDVIDALAELFLQRGVPIAIRSDYGPELVASVIRSWLSKVSVETLYVERSSPWQNGNVGNFHARLRDGSLSCEEFENVTEAKRLASA